MAAARGFEPCVDAALTASGAAGSARSPALAAPPGARRDHEGGARVVHSSGAPATRGEATPLAAAGVQILGTAAVDIEQADDRHQFSAMLDRIGVDQPEWIEVSTTSEAKEFCNRVTYPCLIRPSYVLSGAAMKVVFNDADLSTFLSKAVDVSPDHPVVISKFVE